MPCARGQYLHIEFERAVADRIAKHGLELKEAQKIEDHLLLERTIHVSNCPECWNDPPRSMGTFPVISREIPPYPVG